MKLDGKVVATTFCMIMILGLGSVTYGQLITADLQLHWEASNIDGSNNSTLTNGQKITTWTDSSGNNNNGVANGVGATDIASQPGMGGQPAVNFVGTTAQEQYSFTT